MIASWVPLRLLYRRSIDRRRDLGDADLGGIWWEMDTTLPALPEDTADPWSQPQRQQPQPGPQTPHHTPDTWTTDPAGLWTDTEADPEPLTDSGIDGDLDLWWEDDIDTEAESQKSLRYEDYLRRYLEGDTDLSVLDADTDAAPEKMQQTAPKPKEQIISELAPKISKPGITPGRATIEAQRLYADVERIFGPNADAVLEMFEAGQEPRKFLDGFQNAYLSGKMGSSEALENSGVAAYLTDSQREAAYELGMKSEGTVENDVKGGIINNKKRKLAMSLRRPKGHVLTDAEIKNIMDDARSIGIDVSLLHFNTGTQTAFIETYGWISICGDIMPDPYGETARDRMSQRAVLAHEYYGHYLNDPSPYPVGDWRDEFRASYDAAVRTPNLTDSERRDLMIDAYDRAKEAGEFAGYDETARRIIYGY